MRLWDYRLVKNNLLPKSQLVAQWRELNSIFKKQDNHILINYVYEYSKDDLYVYSLLVMDAMKYKGIKIRNWDTFDKYFRGQLSKNMNGVDIYDYEPFKNHHTEQYLLICFMNLYEKFLRGQKDFTSELFNKLYDFVNKHFDLKQLGIEHKMDCKPRKEKEPEIEEKNVINYIVFSKIGFRYKLPKTLNGEEFDKLKGFNGNEDARILYILCELLGLEREVDNDEEEN